MIQRPLPEELKGSWASLDYSALRLPPDHKFLDRENFMQIHWDRLHQWLPEYLYGLPLKFADISCGNGASMEILQHLGHEAIGTDFSTGFPTGDWMYRPLIESQQLNCICHNGSVLPYPFPDKHFDVLINYGSMTFYQPVDLWPAILDEFARITRSCIFVCVNVGDIYESGRKHIESWRHDGFVLEERVRSHFKWVGK